MGKEKTRRARNKIRASTKALVTEEDIGNEFSGIIGKGGLGIRYFLVKEIEVGIQRTNKEV